jgi:uroporphyrinogen decarboxylase
MKETMTSLERWLAVLNHQIPDRIPLDYWGTPEVTKKIMSRLECQSMNEVAQKLHLDLPFSPSPRYIGPALPPNTDVFGIEYMPIQYGSGQYDEARNAPLAGYHSIKEIEEYYTWPQSDWWDFSTITDQIRGHETSPIRAGGSEPLLTYKQLRGEAQAMIDFVENPDLVQYCLEKLFALAYQNTLRIYENIPAPLSPTITYVAEDMGAQKNLMYSPKHIRQFLFPGMKRMIDLAHGAGAKVFHHNDGNIIRILPELIDLGIDLLNPIQWRADGMDRASLKLAFGSRITLHGAVDNQYTLPFGSRQDVRNEVIENIQILGNNGGYILAPCHNIQPNTPFENILEMYETAYEYGFYS